MAELVARLANSELVVVDVRSHEDFDAGHIPGAMSVPFDELSASACTPPAPLRHIAIANTPPLGHSPSRISCRATKAFVLRTWKKG